MLCNLFGAFEFLFFGPLPVVGFDSDLGFQYGVCCDIFNYGDGTNYPAYNFKINLEASTYTKGSSVLRSYGDFKNIIPEGKLFYDVAYFNSPKYGFYGFNGFAAPYDPNRIVPASIGLANAIAEIGGAALDYVTSTNSDSMVKSVTIDL